MFSTEDLERIKMKFNESTDSVRYKLDITDELPLLSYAENANFGISKALNWAFKLGVKRGMEGRSGYEK